MEAYTHTHTQVGGHKGYPFPPPFSPGSSPPLFRTLFLSSPPELEENIFANIYVVPLQPVLASFKVGHDFLKEKLLCSPTDR